jgi:hypothetical protein
MVKLETVLAIVGIFMVIASGFLLAGSRITEPIVTGLATAETVTSASIGNVALVLTKA